MAAPQAHNPAHTNPIPPAIRRQAEQAEKLQRQATGQPEPVEGEAPVDTGPPPVTDASYQAQPPVVTPPPQPPAADEQLRMVQGRLDAEREQTQNMRGQIASLERMVRDLQEQRRREPPPAAEAPAGNQRGKLVTPEEEEDYGEELLSVMGKRARDAVADEMDGLRDEVRKLQGMLGQVGQRVQARDTNDLFSVLQGKVPGWVEQNSDPEFISWLQQPEPFSGIKRHDLLTRAFELQDAPRVVKFFEGYLNEAAATGQRPQTTPTPSSGNPTNGKVPLETFAAPGRAAQAPASAPPGQKPTYTRSGISQFFTDKAAGKWRGREAEAANIEADIFRAGPEGRVMG